MSAKPATSLAQRIMRHLAEARAPVTTPDLIAATAFGLRNARRQVWAVLERLLRNGHVRRAGRKIERRRFRPTKATKATKAVKTLWTLAE